jgi:outer membrane protein assembly factor BamE
MSFATILGYDAAGRLLIALRLRMQKLLIIILGFSTLIFAGCASDRIADRISDSVPWVYKIDIQQGNVITQEQVDLLRPGMDQRQVQHILGSPMITDPFHPQRWDYPYQFKPGGKEPEITRFTVFFEDGQLASTAGHLHPRPDAAPVDPVSRQMTVTVPYQERQRQGLIPRFWRWITRQNK